MPPMMGNNIDIDMSKLIGRAHQFPFFIPGQITEIEDLQLAESKQNSKRPAILGLIGRTNLGALTKRVRLTAALQGFGDQIAIRANHDDIKSMDR